ncbi:hypothetical protein [Kitasatospora sp. NPDC057223]|uniref:hypothetical protein n=1 Tax=Kitasatospora sp. NPDC057223 TaxID=3346055 RepID=UPI003624FEA8
MAEDQPGQRTVQHSVVHPGEEPFHGGPLPGEVRPRQIRRPPHRTGRHPVPGIGHNRVLPAR